MDQVYLEDIFEEVEEVQQEDFNLELQELKKENEMLKNLNKKADECLLLNINNEHNDKELKEESDKKLRRYLNCIKVERFDDYNDWVRIGFIIYNENGTFELYDEFSKKSLKYDKLACKNKWLSFKDGTIKARINTLIEISKEDNYELYRKAINEDAGELLNKIFKNGIDDLRCAEYFYKKFNSLYIYDIDNKDWYRRNEYGIYEKDSSGIIILKDINNLLIPNIEAEIYKRKKTLQEEEKIIFLKIGNQIEKYLGKNKNKKEGVLEELKILYGQLKIYEKFDNVNNYVIAFKNGIYDLKEDIFRNAKPEELITCTTGFNYEKPKEELIKDINNMLIDIMPDKEERTYLLKTISLGLIGSNPLEECYIWIGGGRNGKGLIRDLIMHTLGDYFSSMEIEYLAKTKHGVSAHAADPIMAKKKNSRIVISTEPEGEMNLRIAKLKQITGNDPVEVRDLFKSTFSFVPKFKMIIQTNKEVSIDGTDKAVSFRLRFIKFPNTFVDNPKQPNERKIDRSLKEKLKEDKYKNAFFHVLLNYYLDFSKNDNNKLIIPKRIKEDTDEYLHSNDPVQQFLDDRIEKTTNEKDFVNSSILFESFKSYIGGDSKLVTSVNFKNIIISKGYTFKKTEKGNVFKFIKFKKEEVQPI